MEDVPPQLQLSLAAVLLSCCIIIIIIIFIIITIIIIISTTVFLIFIHHAVHGKRQTEDRGKHSWRQELLPGGPRRSQPQDEVEGEDDEDDENMKITNTEMKIMLTNN